MLKFLLYNSFKSEGQRDVMEKVITKLNEGQKNFVLSMATQSGKSLIYQAIGGVKDGGLTVIFSLSLALINNQLSYLIAHNIRAESINSQVSYFDRFKIMDELRSENSKIRFLFLTPEMAVYNENVQCLLKELITNNKINMFVVDESHRIVDTRNFRDAFDGLKNYRHLDENIPWIALTTASKAFCEAIADALNMKSPHIIVKSSVRDNIFYDAKSMKDLPKMPAFIKSLSFDTDDEIPSGIIFCRRIEDIIEVVDLLANEGIIAKEYHSELHNRNEVFDDWKNKKFPIIVATDESFGFGIHYNVPIIRFVIHIGIPKSIRHFYQESGRAGNDDEIGYSRMYYSFKHFISHEFVRYLLSGCKRQALASAFHENIEICRDWCDKCVKRCKKEKIQNTISI
jgi:bloom syndrome protein